MSMKMWRYVFDTYAEKYQIERSRWKIEIKTLHYATQVFISSAFNHLKDYNFVIPDDENENRYIRLIIKELDMWRLQCSPLYMAFLKNYDGFCVD